jgi:hypothetical protein
MSNFWATAHLLKQHDDVLTPNKLKVILDDLSESLKRPREEPPHLIRGKDWCDICGLRSWGLWTHE